MAKSRVSGLLFLAYAWAVVAPAAQSEGWSTYLSEKSGYRIDHPAGWKVIETRERASETARHGGEFLHPGVLQGVRFKEPEGSIWPGEFVVAVHEHAPGQTLDEWVDAVNLDVHDESLVMGAEDTVLAGRTARRFSIFGFDHTRITVAFIEEGKIYEVSHAGTNPNDPDIDEHTKIYERMHRSFTVLPTVEADLEGRIGREER